MRVCSSRADGPLLARRLNDREDKALNEFAGWVAPIATMIAAMMTAANLGARVTGWGFVVFTIGSVFWATVGLISGQTNLLATNVFLTAVNVVGIWRWLGRQRAYEDGGNSAKMASRASSEPTLFTATGIAGMTVAHTNGDIFGRAVEALIECRLGVVSYVVVATAKGAGIGEDLRSVPRAAITFGCDKLVLTMPREDFEALAPLEAGDWPGAAG